MSPNLPTPEPRFIAKLRERLEKEGNMSKLANAIASANDLGPEDPRPIERRKLAQLLESPNTVKISFPELWAISRYLEGFNEGLGHRPLFCRPDFVQSLADRGSVTFLLGSRPHGPTADLAIWDVQSMAEIQRALSKYRRDIQFDTRCVSLHGSHDEQGETWADVLGPDGPSLVAIGSGRASPGSEAMLAQMFEIEPGNPEAGDRLPFRFVWSESDWPPDATAPTSFAMPVSELEALAPDVADSVRQHNSRAFVLGNEAFLAEQPHEPSVRSFGVVVAQRRKNDQVWMVIAGLTGASTHAAARAVEKIAATVPDTLPGGHSPIICTVIQTRIDREQGEGGPKMPTVHSESLFRPSFYWPEPAA